MPEHSRSVQPARGGVDARIGFCVHMAEMVNHYLSVWRSLPTDQVCLVLPEASMDKTEIGVIRSVAERHGFECLDCGQVVDEGRVFGVLVSNHPYCLDSSPERLWSLGRTHVRFLYGLGKAQWNFSSWNARYHTILCWGRFHADNLRRFAHVHLEQVGYCRFDDYFNRPIDRQSHQTRLGLDAGRLTVLWLPTWGALCSIDAFAAAVGRLQRWANVVVKLHTLTVQREPQRLTRMAEAGLTRVVPPHVNNTELLALADVVLADYGGSPFAAIYARKPLLLLDVPHPETDPLTGSQSLDLELRKWLPHVPAHQANELEMILRDRAAWRVDQPTVEALRDYVFAPHPGTAGRRAAEVLQVLLQEVGGSVECGT